MTPGARLAAAIEVMDDVLDGNRADTALKAWGRRSRFAGSKDRRAVRDHVFDMLRCKRSYAALGGALTGRGLAIGLLRSQGRTPSTLMTGEGHAPSPPSQQELERCSDELAPEVKSDAPNWIYKLICNDMGAEAQSYFEALRHRAPVFVRVNLARTTVRETIDLLGSDQIAAETVDGVETALRVVGNSTRIAASAAYQDGLIELQDASSQAAVLELPIAPGDNVLDFCAGGGGKALAIAALAPLRVTAHDALPHRMKDLQSRAMRAGCQIMERSLDNLVAESFDLVIVDAPCSGSGTWRRDPEGKWRLDPSDLEELIDLQFRILNQASQFVGPGGHLAYATCSVLRSENDEQTDRFCAENTGFTLVKKRHWMPSQNGDGFFLCLMAKDGNST